MYRKSRPLASHLSEFTLDTLNMMSACNAAQDGSCAALQQHVSQPLCSLIERPKWKGNNIICVFGCACCRSILLAFRNGLLL